MEIRWRPGTSADASHLADLFQEVERRAPVGLETDLADIQLRLSNPRLDLEHDTLVAIGPEGEILAYAEAADMGVGNGAVRVRLTNAVRSGDDPALAESTHAWLIDRATQIRQQRQPELPCLLAARCASADHARFEMLRAGGFNVSHQHQELVRSLGSSSSPAPTPRGFMFQAYDRHLDEATRLAHNAASADNPNAFMPDAETWPRHAVGLPAFLPQASFVALPSGNADIKEVASFVLSLEDDDIDGDRIGVLHCVGTTSPWRQQGLASTLIQRALNAYYESGLQTARVRVSDTNIHAHSLYTRLDFVDSGRGYMIMMASLP